MNVKSPTGAELREVHEFLAKYPDVQGIDVVLNDCHGIGRGKTIRRHELDALYLSGRPIPASMFGQVRSGTKAVVTSAVGGGRFDALGAARAREVGDAL